MDGVGLPFNELTRLDIGVETLAEPESNGEARGDIRSLIGEVVITPGEKRGESHATLRGELMAILVLAAGRRISPETAVITNALAGPGFEPISVKFREL
jgi:site-specific DNA recombinase